MNAKNLFRLTLVLTLALSLAGCGLRGLCVLYPQSPFCAATETETRRIPIPTVPTAPPEPPWHFTPISPYP